MNNYKKQISKGMSFMELLCEITPKGSPDWSQWQAAYWIFIEDGGKMDFQDFLKIAPPAPIPYAQRQDEDLEILADLGIHGSGTC